MLSVWSVRQESVGNLRFPFAVENAILSRRWSQAERWKPIMDNLTLVEITEDRAGDHSFGFEIDSLRSQCCRKTTNVISWAQLAGV